VVTLVHTKMPRKTKVEIRISCGASTNDHTQISMQPFKSARNLALYREGVEKKHGKGRRKGLERGIVGKRDPERDPV
jgi:hypothetical protein